MTGDDDVLRQFQQAISGAELDDLRSLTDTFLNAAQPGYLPPSVLRKPRLAEPVIYRIRVELDGSLPVIWRTLELRSDLRLDLVHSILQNAFGWNDSHLHRFALGGDPFDRRSLFFLCPYDMQAGEEEGIPTGKVGLDETMQEPGDVLNYVYDYGDSWDLTLRLEAVLPLAEDGPAALCVAGERAAPPDDCGGLRRAEDLIAVLDDLEEFDLDEINHWLLDPLLVLAQEGLNPALVNVLQRLRGTHVADEVYRLALGLLSNAQRLTTEGFDTALAPVQWFLERAAGAGFELTSSGYLKPDDVVAAAQVIPQVHDWIGAKNREQATVPVLRFRKALQSVGLLRKSKGRLVLTKAGRQALLEPEFLWGHIASRMIPAKPQFDREAASVLLLCATVPEGRADIELAQETMNAAGWRADGDLINYFDMIEGNPVMDLLLNFSGICGDFEMGPAARAMAVEALFWGS